MPWKVRKRACKQKSTGKEGTHVVVKVKRGGGEEQESCHLSEPKAQGALRARYASKNEARLRRFVRCVLTEGEADIVELGVRLRIADRAAMGDVLTDLRGIEGVITVKQEGSAVPGPGAFRTVNVYVAFEDDASRDAYALQRDIEALDGVEAATIKNYEGRRWSEVEATYKGGAASKEQK